ncbi:MAG: cyclopropane-fatty-acyl-phospholipid synthase family protein [Pseudomonadota bacterium]
MIDAHGGREVFGDGTGETYAIKLHDDRVPRELIRHPAVRFGELYASERWSVVEGDLVGLLKLVFENMAKSPTPGWRQALSLSLRYFKQNNTAVRARRNAQHHYDVGNDIYAEFLDEDWQYSCAYFAEPGISLEEAQLRKKRHIAAKMLLEPGQRVLDIGCGWGGMALYLADHLGVDVTGISLAERQVERAKMRAGGRPDVRFLLKDYRAIDDTFDRIVSVGMFEHVGIGFFREYFDTCRRLMSDDGVMVLHSIGRIGPPGITAPFIDKYIFPGGYIPSLSEVLPVIEASGLIVTDIEIWRLHYAETLAEWRKRFNNRRSSVVGQMGERFFLIWDFYLAASEAAFRAADLMVFQIQLSKRLDTVPLTRDYIGAVEAALATRDSGKSAGPALVAQRQ